MDTRVAGPRTKDDAYEVSDPTDWQGTPLASLAQVEYSLRCHVCKDFYNSPMITSCCHTFCSLCIRRALNTDGKCPLCRATDQESKLRGNFAIREAVHAFIGSRDTILELARKPAAAASALSAVTPKRKVDEEVDDGSVRKRTRMSTRSSSARASQATATIMKEEADLLETKEEEEYIPDDGLVECPICTWRMEPQKVDRHLDTNCPGEPRPQPIPSRPNKFGFATARNNKPAATPGRLSALNYSLLNETKLRKKLLDLGIPSWGSRLVMEKRHKEWVMIWNANCDSVRPKVKQELLRDLDTWERTQGGLAPTSSVAASLGAQIKDKNFDGAGWSTKHNDSFKDLIANARKSQKKAEAPIKPQQTTPAPSDIQDAQEPNLSGTSHMQPVVLEAGSETPPGRSSITIDLSSPLPNQLDGVNLSPG